MKIIFSPSKEMDFGTQIKSPIISKIPSEEKMKVIYEKLIQLSKEEIIKKFKIKDEMYINFSSKLNNFENLVTKPSIEAYTGLAFRQLKLNDYTLENWEYISENLLILSAFYGITRGTDEIKEYRLDFTTKIFEEMSMYRFWEKFVNDYFEKNETIINLASQEYSKLISKEKVNLVDFLFYENLEFKQISANSKKARGEMLNLLIENKVRKVKDIKKLKMKEYILDTTLSSNNKYVYIKVK